MHHDSVAEHRIFFHHGVRMNHATLAELNSILNNGRRMNVHSEEFFFFGAE